VPSRQKQIIFGPEEDFASVGFHSRIDGYYYRMDRADQGGRPICLFLSVQLRKRRGSLGTKAQEKAKQDLKEYAPR
jgi:hypothetical protein